MWIDLRGTWKKVVFVHSARKSWRILSRLDADTRSALPVRRQPSGEVSTARNVTQRSTKMKSKRLLLSWLRNSASCPSAVNTTPLVVKQLFPSKSCPNIKDCAFRPVQCEYKGCKAECPLKDLESHMEKCDYRLVECKVCKMCLPRKDMPAHQAIKRCFEQLNKRRMVTSARRLSQELKDHRLEMLHQRHLTDQEERRVLKEYYSRDFVPVPRRRTMSAGPVLLRSSIQARVGSALVVPHYSRNLKSATLESCRGCSNKFLSGRRPSAQRHTHSKVSE